MSDLKFVEGLFFNKSEKAPDFVGGTVSIKPEEFSKWLSEQAPDEAGFVKIAILKSKKGKWYGKIDDWKPQKEENDLPF